MNLSSPSRLVSFVRMQRYRPPLCIYHSTLRTSAKYIANRYSSSGNNCVRWRVGPPILSTISANTSTSQTNALHPTLYSACSPRRTLWSDSLTTNKKNRRHTMSSNRTLYPASNRNGIALFTTSCNGKSISTQMGIAPTNINLTISPKIISSSCQLPEVKDALEIPVIQASKSIPLLSRSLDIFEMVGQEKERDAVRYMLAQRQLWDGKHQDASNNLKTLLSSLSDQQKGEELNLKLAVAKCKFLGGNDMKEAMQICKDIDDGDGDGRERSFGLMGVGLTRLLLHASTQSGDAEEVLAPLRDAADFFCREMHDEMLDDVGRSELGLVAAAALGNLGIAEAVLFCSTDNDADVDKLEHENAFQTWNKALSILESTHTPEQPKQEAQQYHTALNDTIRARIYCNMAFAILAQASSGKVSETNLQKASKYSQTALKLYEQIIIIGEEENSSPDPHHVLRPSMGRALTLVAACYARAGSAVTAEGLYQSAVDMLVNEEGSWRASQPLSALDAHYSLLSYAALCKNWEKRTGDADKLTERAEDVWDVRVPISWRGDASGKEITMTGLFSGLWFMHPGDFILTEDVPNL